MSKGSVTSPRKAKESPKTGISPASKTPGKSSSKSTGDTGTGAGVTRELEIGRAHV